MLDLPESEVVSPEPDDIANGADDVEEQQHGADDDIWICSWYPSSDMYPASHERDGVPCDTSATSQSPLCRATSPSRKQRRERAWLRACRHDAQWAPKSMGVVGVVGTNAKAL